MADGKELKNNLSESKEILSGLREEGQFLQTTFKEIVASLRDSAKNSEEFSEAIKLAGTDANSLAASAAKLAVVNKDILKDENAARALAKEVQSIKLKKLKVEQQIKLFQEKAANATGKEAKNIQKTLKNLYAASEAAAALEGSFDEINAANADLNKKTAFFKGMEDTLKTIPGIGPAIAGPFGKAAKAAREARVEGGGFVKATAAAGNQLMAAFGPAALLGMIIKGNKAATEFNRTLGMSRDQAFDMRKQMEQVRKSNVTLNHMLQYQN